MTDLEDKEKLKSTPGGKPDISVIEASLDSLSKEIIEIKKDIKDQRNANRNIIIGVLVASVFIAITVAVEVILFHSNADKNLLDIQNRYFQEIQDLKERNFQSELRFQREIDSLKEKIVNPTIPSVK